jgi:hypothetical protein
MPREKINDETTTGWYTEVSWRRQPQTAADQADQGSAPGHVQLATVNALSPFHFPDIDTGDHFEAGEKFDGWRVTLDEAGIDHLIKVLHKARRQAFGGDKIDVFVSMPDGMAPAEGADHAAEAIKRVQDGQVEVQINQPVDIDLNETG